nr:hypothetical protein [uncultured Campylobacter sp.]
MREIRRRFTLQKIKLCQIAKIVNLIRPREVIKMPLLADKIYAPKENLLENSDCKRGEIKLSSFKLSSEPSV